MFMFILNIFGFLTRLLSSCPCPCMVATCMRQDQDKGDNKQKED